MDSEWTNSESSRSKVAISDLRYIRDPFCAQLCNQSALRRSPEINRGYYARYMAVDHVVRNFCSQEGDSTQVVNIGSGFDSLYWRLASDGVCFARVVDVDSDHVIANKIHSIDKSDQLSQLLADRREERPRVPALHSRRYHAIGADATKAKRLTEVLSADCDIRQSDPLLVVLECVLLYWTADQTQNLIHTLSKTFKSVAFVVFDVVNTDDTFARLMQDSLSRRDTPLLGVSSSQTLDDWLRKFVANGCPNAIAWDMNTVYESLLPSADRQRVERLELLDERQLLTQLLAHYCLVMANNYSQSAAQWPHEWTRD